MKRQASDSLPCPHEFALDEIEREIRHIDQMVKSWSNGRTLRFDPAHVPSTSKLSREKTSRDQSHPGIKPPLAPAQNKQLSFFLLNVTGFIVPVILICLTAFQIELTAEIKWALLTMALMFVGGGNLFLAAYQARRVRLFPPSTEQAEAGPESRQLKVLPANDLPS